MQNVFTSEALGAGTQEVCPGESSGGWMTWKRDCPSAEVVLVGALNPDDGIPLCGVIYLSDVIADCDVQLNDKIILIHQTRHYAAMKELTQQPVRQVLVHQISNMVSSAVKRHVIG